MTPPTEQGTAVSSPTDAEVWLRGNPRPALALGCLMVAGGLAAVVAVVAAAAPRWVVTVVLAACAMDAIVAAGFAWAASRPRLVHRGGFLEIRLSPTGIERVPLEVVECVFPGTQPLGADDGTADRRVGTLVLRLAERAAAWQTRPVAAAWGEWKEGNVVFDGRWCEPLSQALARDLSGRLLEARRRLVTEAS